MYIFLWVLTIDNCSSCNKDRPAAAGGGAWEDYSMTEPYVLCRSVGQNNNKSGEEGTCGVIY